MDLFRGLNNRLILVNPTIAITEENIRKCQDQRRELFGPADAYGVQQMSNKAFVVLSSGFTIKSSQNRYALCGMAGEGKFELENDQADFLTQCDGTKRKEELLDQYSADSQNTVKEFMANLYGIGALEDHDNSLPRKISILEVRSPRLETVHFEPFSKCNMVCIHCYQGERYNRRRDNLTLEEMKNSVKQMADLGVDGASISGGEPFIDLEILDVARFMEENGIRVQAFFTNGTLLTDDVINQVLALKSHPTFFVSFDGYNEFAMNFRGFNHIKGKEVVDTIKATIKKLVRSGFKVVVNTVYNWDNFLDLEKMHDLMKDFGVHSWRVGYPKRTGTFASKDYQGFEVRFDRALKKFLELLEYHFRQGKPFDLQIEYLYRAALIDNFEEVSGDDYVCDYEGRRESCCIKPNGDVVACAYCCDQVIGNIKQQSLSDIWYSPAMRAIKDLQVKDIEECKDCESRRYCATGCRANACFLGGEFAKSKDSYACDSVKFFIERVLPFIKGNT